MISFIHALKEVPHVFGSRDAVTATHLSQQSVRLPSDLFPAKRSLNFAANSSQTLKEMVGERVQPQEHSKPSILPSARLQTNSMEKRENFHAWVSEEVRAMAHKNYAEDQNGTLETIVASVPVPPVFKVAMLGIHSLSRVLSVGHTFSTEVNAAKALLMGVTKQNAAARYLAIKGMINGAMGKALEIKRKIEKTTDPAALQKLTETQNASEVTIRELNKVANTLKQQERVLKH